MRKYAIALLGTVILFAGCKDSTSLPKDVPGANTQSTEADAYRRLATLVCKSHYKAEPSPQEITLIKGDELRQWIAANESRKSPAINAHNREVMGAYLQSPGCKAAFVRHAFPGGVTELIVLEIPREFLNPAYAGMMDWLVDNGPGLGESGVDIEYCDYCSGQYGQSDGFIGSGQASDPASCVCACECVPKQEGPCGNTCTEC